MWLKCVIQTQAEALQADEWSPEKEQSEEWKDTPTYINMEYVTTWHRNVGENDFTFHMTNGENINVSGVLEVDILKALGLFDG